MQYSDAFQFASEFVFHTNHSIFLTGKAGTGKTTFLKHCKDNGAKKTAVVAPTGVAAMNAGGTTIHSFFQLSFAPFIPTASYFQPAPERHDKNSLLNRLRLTTERRAVLQQLELLIIDEISMVRCDVLDAIDVVLQHVRKAPGLPFGGVQVLLIGDMYQLPPVIRDEEWALLSPHYKSPYFFNSHVIEQSPPAYIELDFIYRQKDPAFVHILNQVRNNEMDQQGFQLLHSRYQPDFIVPPTGNFITLTTHNARADAINTAALQALKKADRHYTARVEGEFSEKAYPAELSLKLKEGAQVMFIKNDVEKPRRFYNGKIGVVASMEEDKIYVQCEANEPLLEVRKERWKNIRYVVDKTTNQVEEEEIGAFTQFPLRLAWAITIHKSQGLTFEKAVIDAGEAFAPGQVYVALSRCTSLEGMVLRSRIAQHRLFTDSRITNFAASKTAAGRQLALLDHAKHDFQQSLIKSAFNLGPISTTVAAIVEFTLGHPSTLMDGLEFVKELQSSVEALAAIALKFELQLSQLMHSPLLPEENEPVQIRVKAGAAHFISKLTALQTKVENCPANTLSHLVASGFNQLLLDVYDALCFQLHVLRGCSGGFALHAFLQHKKSFVKTPLNTNAFADKEKRKKRNGTYSELLTLLETKRDEICKEKDLPFFAVASMAALQQMVKQQPETLSAMKQITALTPASVQLYGAAFAEVIQNYLRNNPQAHKEATSTTTPGTKKFKRKKGETKNVSLVLFQQGNSVAAIAAARGLAVGTVEYHLTQFLTTGEIKLDQLVTRETQALIKKALALKEYTDLKTLKENLPPDIRYREIKMVLAAEQLLPAISSKG